ncbi:MAG: sensor histidine kinase [Fimbriiglobus sp.]
MINSIRIRQLLWSALVLAGVVSGFGGFLYYEVQSARRGEVDARLIIAATALDTMLRGSPPQEFRPQDEPPGKPRPKRPNPPPFLTIPEVSRERFLTELQLPPDFPDHYFAVYRPDGTLVKSVGMPEGSPITTEALPQPRIRTKGSHREVVILGPGRSIVVVGRSLDHVERDLQGFAQLLVFTGIVVLLIGLFGEWIISRRMLRPIAIITTAASRISEHNLTERIDPKQVEVELAELTQVLNGTFDRLKEAFDRQTQFTADASHELRTPLSVIRSQAELSLSRPRAPEEYQQALRSCLKSSIQMTELVERLLLLARADGGLLRGQVERVDLDRLLEEVAGPMRSFAEEKGIIMTIHSAPAQTKGDPAALGQVLTNLLMNAIQYNRPGGSVEARVEAQDGEVIVAVKDTGVGIPLADQPHIFERFYRVDQARSRSSGGTGLGLAICKKIIEAHHGTIGFESQEQVGSEFILRLPRYTPTWAES